jgi:F0F1-type ATP synthase assembly protein I
VKALRWQGAPAADNDALSLAMAMVAVPVVFGLVGWWVDGLLGTGPILLIAFAAFGVLCSFASAWYRYERRIAEHESGKPWARPARKVTG